MKAKQRIDMMIHLSMMNDMSFIVERMMFQITRFIKTYSEYRCTGTKVIKSRYPMPNTVTIRIYFEKLASEELTVK